MEKRVCISSSLRSSLEFTLLTISPEMKGQSRNTAAGPPFKTLCRTRDRDGEDEPILQNAVYKNIGEYNKVVYVFAHEREQAPPARRRGVDMLPKGPNLLPSHTIGVTDPGSYRLGDFSHARSALKAESHHSA